MKIYIINGPNLNLLGKRSPEIYGSESLSDVVFSLKKKAEEKGAELISFQSNHEGELIDFIHTIGFEKDNAGIIFNPGAYSHYSYALRDAVEAIPTNVIIVHISNIYKREDFRHKDVIAPVAKAIISGLGIKGYELALNALFP